MNSISTAAGATSLSDHRYQNFKLDCFTIGTHMSVPYPEGLWPSTLQLTFKLSVPLVICNSFSFFSSYSSSSFSSHSSVPPPSSFSISQYHPSVMIATWTPFFWNSIALYSNMLNVSLLWKKKCDLKISQKSVKFKLPSIFSLKKHITMRSFCALSISLWKQI